MSLAAAVGRGLPQVDNNTLEYSSGTLRVKNAGSFEWLTRIAVFGGAEGVSLSIGAAAIYAPPSGDAATSGTEANVEITVAAACTITGLAGYVSANTYSTGAGAAITLRKNGADTALTASIGTTTGSKSANGSISVAAGDRLAISIQEAASGTGAATVKGLRIIGLAG